MPERNVLSFDQFSKLPPALFTASLAVIKLSNRHVIFDEITQIVRGFDWNSFKGTVAAQQGNIGFDKLQSTKITNPTASVDEMADKIAKFLTDTFAVKTEMDAIRAQISAAFENLEVKKSEGLFHSFKEEQHGSSWEYRVVFGFPNPDTPEWFYALVSTIKLTADIVNAKGWFGITGQSKHNFSADITAMELIVNKDFQLQTAA